MDRFPDKFTCNFDENKHLVDALTKGTTTKVRNQIAGYITNACSIAQGETEAPSENDEEDET